MRSIALLVFVVACGKSEAPAKQEAPAAGSAAGSSAVGAPREMAPVAADDWTTRTLVPTDAIVDGVAFTIGIPEGLPSQEPGVWADARVGEDLTFQVFTTVLEGRLVTSIDKAKYHSTAHVGETKFLRAEATDDGFAITGAPAEDVIEAATFTKAGDGWLKCKATRSGQDRSEEARALVEGICDSVLLK